MHAGVAQGGHYYSFICDNDSATTSSTTPTTTMPTTGSAVATVSSSSSGDNVIESDIQNNTNTTTTTNNNTSNINNYTTSITNPLTTTTTTTNNTTNTNKEKRWYRFDDEDVTHFTIDQIATQCFGGPPGVPPGGSVSGANIGEDRTANALMLFFNKVRNNDPLASTTTATTTTDDTTTNNNTNIDSTTTAAANATSIATHLAESSMSTGDGDGNMDIIRSEVADTSSTVPLSLPLPLPPPHSLLPPTPSFTFHPTLPQGAVLVNGYDAYSREVKASNLEHILSCYVLDNDLHNFVKELVASITKSSIKEKILTGMFGYVLLCIR